MLNFGFVGLGQAGGNVSEYAMTKGMSSLAINTARVDLDLLKYIPNENRIFLEGYNGAGRNMEIGKNAMVEHAEEVYDKCKQKIGNCDVVFVSAAGGGGTGAGSLSVALDILLDLVPCVCTFYIFPDNLESPSAKMNAYDCFAELSHISQLSSVFILDNQKGKDLHPGLPKFKVYQNINRQFIDFITEINMLTNKQSYTNNFDEKDLMDILNTHGCTLVSKAIINSKNINEKDISAAIQDSWVKTYSPEYDLSQIIKAGILGKVNKSMSNRFNLERIFNSNIPYDTRDSLYVPNNNELVTFYSIFSGLQFPNTRVEQLKSDVEKIQDQIAQRFETVQNQTIETNSWKLNIPRVSANKNSNSTQSLSEKLKKYK